MLPDGFFVITHVASRQIVATALAVNAPTSWWPVAGELGWVGGSNEHSGKRLGRAVSSAAVARLVDAGYRFIYSVDRGLAPACADHLSAAGV